jgi:hypothetical protein
MVLLGGWLVPAGDGGVVAGGGALAEEARDVGQLTIGPGLFGN